MPIKVVGCGKAPYPLTTKNVTFVRLFMLENVLPVHASAFSGSKEAVHIREIRIALHHFSAFDTRELLIRS
jgi:hypothetical protein